MSPSADGPSLGDRLSARRAASPDRPAPTPSARPDRPRESSTTRALGAGTGLLATFVAAIAFAFVLSRLVGGTYVTFAMPIFAGTLIAALASIGPKRFGFGDRRTLVMMMVGGALVCWLGQHMLAYLRVIDIVAAQPFLIPSGATQVALTGVDPAEIALRSLERATGESGFFAYLSFVSHSDGALLSPIGFLGRTEPGTVGTILIAIGELGLMALSASWSILYRTRHIRRAAAGPIAFFDEATASAVSVALQARRFDELAAIIAASRDSETHALAIEEGEVTAEAVILERDASGQLSIRASSRLMPIEAAGRLRRAVTTALAGVLSGVRTTHLQRPASHDGSNLIATSTPPNDEPRPTGTAEGGSDGPRDP